MGGAGQMVHRCSGYRYPHQCTNPCTNHLHPTALEHGQVALGFPESGSRQTSHQAWSSAIVGVSIAALEAKWSARLVEWRELGVTVLGEKIALEVLADLRGVGDDVHDDAELCAPSVAGPRVGYH